MLTRSSSRFFQVLAWTFVTGMALPAAMAAAVESGVELAASAEPKAAAAPIPAEPCAALAKQLRFREPFFGMSSWSEAAAEALAYAPTACRQAIAAGKAPGVAQALKELAEHAPVEHSPLRRFVYRMSCQLRVPEAPQLIIDGLHEPYSYSECADALFAMPLRDSEALELRERYIEGLRNEPVKTHLPSGILNPPFGKRLAPVLAAYDKGHIGGRDALYQAVCKGEGEIAAEAQALCAEPADREQGWVKDKLLAGDLDGGLARLAAFKSEQQQPFFALLKQFEAEKRPGRDRFYRVLCQRSSLTTQAQEACSQLFPNAEARWRAGAHEAQQQAEVNAYYHAGRVAAGILLALSILIFAHGVYSSTMRQRRLQAGMLR